MKTQILESGDLVRVLSPSEMRTATGAALPNDSRWYNKLRSVSKLAIYDRAFWPDVATTGSSLPDVTGTLPATQGTPGQQPSISVNGASDGGVALVWGSTKNLAIPSAVGAACGNQFTVYIAGHVNALPVGGNQWQLIFYSGAGAYLDIHISSSGQVIGYIGPDSGHLKGLTNSAGIPANSDFLIAMTFNLAAGTSSLYVNGKKVSGDLTCSATLAAIQIGINNAGLSFDGHYRHISIFSGIMSDEDVDLAGLSICDGMKVNVFAHGDSLTSGNYTGVNQPYPTILQTTLGNAYEVINAGTLAYTLIQLNQELPTKANANVYGVRKYSIVWGLTNDEIAGASADTCVNRLWSLCDAHRQFGRVVIVCTAINRNMGAPSHWVTEQAANARIRLEYRSHAHALADLGGIPQLQSYSDNPTLYTSDGSHLSDLGNAFIVPYIKSRIDMLQQIYPHIRR